MINLENHLLYLKLPYVRENHESVAASAARKNWTHIHFLSELIKQESGLRKDKMIQRRIRMAKFPCIT